MSSSILANAKSHAKMGNREAVKIENVLAMVSISKEKNEEFAREDAMPRS
ncbi:MAG: hypothetical protein KA015_04880 [Spirochaetes bacterium]|nr:hypothetical protein [Spirochaetota bacterium]